MTILKIIEALQSYSEDVLAYKLDGGFANAVTEAVSLLIGQGEQIADLENKLATVNGGWIPTSLGLYPDKQGTYLCLVKFPEAKEAFPYCLNWHPYGYNGFINGPHFSDEGMNGMRVTHWMPIPDCPNDKIDYEAR